jgi:AbrB family looped-hinge helix DNA binding protein
VVKLAIPTRVDGQGRVQIPAPIRRELNISSGQVLIATVEGGRIILEKEEENDG